ncbi:MAG TPA: hypothetical protein ENN46_03570 [Candidatus Woesearchaeota archaeon]|nr:hypothetical protein [Candidatus Woesearchaeota archaeon]
MQAIQRLERFLAGLEEEELMEILRVSGESKEFLNNELKKEFTRRREQAGQRCTVCGNVLPESSFELVFGSPEFRRKAKLCGKDCVSYFLESIESYNELLKRKSERSNGHRTEREEKDVQKKPEKKPAKKRKKTLLEKMYSLFF